MSSSNFPSVENPIILIFLTKSGCILATWAANILVDCPTQLICISDIYLLSWRWQPLWSGGLLYQWPVRPKKAGQTRFFFKDLNYMYTDGENANNRAKNGQKPSKKPAFSSPSSCPYGFGLKCCATFQAKPIQTAGGAGKNCFFGGFIASFCPVFCLFAHNLYMKCLFCKKNRSDWPPLAIGASIVKVRHVQGVATSCYVNRQIQKAQQGNLLNC